MLGTGQVADEIRRRPSGEDLRVFWVLVFDESRDRFAKDLAEQAVAGDRATVPWVLRDPGVFNDANSTMTDVADVLEAARTEIEAIGDGVAGVDLVLLARRELSMADASSPVQLPDWWPVERVRGALVTTTVQDLTWSTGVPLSDEVAALGDLSRLLYELDVMLVNRLAQMSSNTCRRVSKVPGSGVESAFAGHPRVLGSSGIHPWHDGRSCRVKMPAQPRRACWKTIDQYAICIPPRELAAAYQGATQPALDNIIANIHSNVTLASLRDTRLPELISCEIRASQAERSVEAVAGSANA